MNPKLTALREQVAALRSELLELDALETLTDEQEQRAAAALAEFDTVKADLDAAEARAAKIEEIRKVEVAVETADDPKRFNTNVHTEDIHDLSELRHMRPDSAEFGTAVRDRAMRAIEGWRGVDAEHRESAERLIADATVSQRDRDVAAHILRTGSDAYREAFARYMQGGEAVLTSEQRTALNEGTTTQGGFLVPPMLDPTIILTNDGATNPIRGLATVKSITTKTWKGVTSAGITAEWTAEAAQVADASPTVAQPSITPVRADAYAQASMEMVEDTNIAAELSGLFADARDRHEATGFVTGTGSTQPVGIVTALQLVTASRVAGSSGVAGAADYVVADVYALANALPPRHRPNSSWLAEQSTYNRTRQFATGTGPSHAFWADLGVGIPPLLLGRPAYESSAMDSTIVSGSNDDILILGDFKKFCVVDRVGMSLLYEPNVKGANQRPTGEVGWVVFWRVGSDVLDANAFRMLRV